jgi:succinate-semialdehyde dehydrogenase/glutarate-semialdehyde dehydrogenase
MPVLEYPALHMVIGGERVSGGGRRTFDVINPVTGEAISALPLAKPADLDRALDAAQRGFANWRKAPA